MKDEKGKTLPWLIAAIILVGIPLVLAFIQIDKHMLFLYLKNNCEGWIGFIIFIVAGIAYARDRYGSKKNNPDQQNADPGDALSDNRETDVWDFSDDADGGFGDGSDDGE